MFVASIVYKAKISVTSFLLKMFVRRVLGRAFVRGWLPFVAVPVTALWNAYICRLVMREARIRAMGPSAVTEMIDIAFSSSELGRTPVSRLGKAAILRAVASSIVRTEDLHPNLVALLREVAGRVHETTALDPRQRLHAGDEGGDLDDTRAFLACLSRLEHGEQTLALRVLAIASIIDGRLTRAERRLLAEAHAACGRSYERARIEGLLRVFVDGDRVEPRMITAL